MSQALSAHAARLEPHLRVIKPEGPGPFPVVLQMHGCGGREAMQFDYAAAAREAGIAAVVINSLAPRGLSRLEARLTLCTGLQLRGAERAHDLLATLHWLKGQAWADPHRLAAAGWSHGAWSVMEAMVALTPDAAEAGAGAAALKFTALFYPYAGPTAHTASRGWAGARPKVFACVGGRDRVVGRAAPLRALRRLQDDGLAVEILDLPQATHAFDDPVAVDPRFTYRADLTEQARGAYLAALRGALVGGQGS